MRARPSCQLSHFIPSLHWCILRNRNPKLQKRSARGKSLKTRAVVVGVVRGRFAAGVCALVTWISSRDLIVFLHRQVLGVDCFNPAEH